MFHTVPIGIERIIKSKHNLITTLRNYFFLYKRYKEYNFDTVNSRRLKMISNKQTVQASCSKINNIVTLTTIKQNWCINLGF